MSDEQINLTPAEANKMRRSITAMQKRIRSMHDLRGRMNTALARVTDQNLDLALTQKKNLKALRSAQGDGMACRMKLNNLPIAWR